MNAAEQYIKDVDSGKILVCEYVKLAIVRHKKDLKKARRKAYPYKFDRNRAQRAIDIFKLLRHTKGAFAKRPFDLQPYQAFILWSIFGWVKKSDGNRRFTKVYFSVARKAGKSEFAAGIGLIGLIFDNEYGAEVYSAATKRDQAKIVFERAKAMAKLLKKDSDHMAKLIGVHQHNIHILSTESKFEAVSSDADTLDGPSPSMAIIDEYHAHKTSDVLEVIETGMGARLQPLLLIITTRGFNPLGPCGQYEKVCIDVLRGVKEDETEFVLIFTLDEGDDWNNKTLWIKANPNLGRAPYWSYMDAMYNKAMNQGVTKEIQFKTKNLNVWTNTFSTWIPDEKLKAAQSKIELSTLKGRECYAGLDLASIRDLAALALLFPPENDDEKFTMIFRFWAPSEGIAQRSKSDGVPYHQWAREGWLTATEGNVIDYDFITSDIIELLEIYNIRLINYDRWNATQPVLSLIEKGAQVNPFGQGFASMGAPTSALERMILAGEINPGLNPIFRWCVSNVALKLDPAGNGKIDKSKSHEKVDGAVAAVMALAAYQKEQQKEPAPRSVYEDRGMIIINKALESEINKLKGDE